MWRYVKGWRDQTTSDALEIGTLVHRGLELFWSGEDWPTTRRRLIIEQPSFFSDDEGKVYMAQVLAYVGGYFKTYGLKEWETLGVEETFDIKIEGIRFSGKLDARARRLHDGKQMLIEHKTAKYVDDRYWKKLASGMNTQLVLYREAVRQMTGEDCGVLYDVVKKTTGGPAYKAVDGKLTRPRKRKAETEQEFEERKALHIETLEEYTDRLTNEYTGMYQEDYYVRKEITCTEDEHQEALRDLLFVGSMVDASEETERYPRNSNNCFSYGRYCEYFEICAGTDTPETSGHLALVEDLHPELKKNEEVKNDKPF
jgi:hypothetical protein